MNNQESTLEACVIYDDEGGLVACDDNFRKLYRYSEEDVKPGVLSTELDQLDIDRGIVIAGSAYDGNEDYLTQKAEYRRSLEGTFTVELADGRVIKLTDRRLSTGGFVSIQTDITEQKRINEELQRTSDMFMSAFHFNSNLCTITILETGEFLDVNEAWAQMLGYDRLEVIGKTAVDLNIWGNQENRDSVVSKLQTDGFLKDHKSWLQTKSGARREFLITANMLTISDTECLFFSGTDMTEQLLDQQALEHSKERFADFTKSSLDWYWETDQEDCFSYISPDIAVSTGIPENKYIGHSAWGFISRNTAAQDSLDVMQECVRDRRPFRDLVYWRLNPETGEKYWLRSSGIPFFDEDGKFLGFRGSSSNVSEQKTLEEKLQQSQKMEAVGQLTGGVAHDFNNLLAVILGNMELLKDDLETGQPIHENQMDAVLRAAARGAELTQNMLSFSRKQDLQPKVIKLERQVEAMISLLNRTLGENIDIKVRFGDDLWACRADPGKVENALLNMAINARDAMPEGGTLTIEVENTHLDKEYTSTQTGVTPGQYVMLAVSDTGVGIPPDVVSHVFEPFYTTKEIGKGTGLGLSMIYGFAQQSGGHVAVYSEVGHGTTLKLYLPRSQAAGKAEKPIHIPAHKNNDGTVLVVEDDKDVRSLILALLSTLGYQVRMAKEGTEALRILTAEENIDLLLTDAILPGSLSGPDVAKQARLLKPSLPVLLMSGYTEEAMASHNLAIDNIELLQKPFRKTDLAEKVQKAMQTTA